MNKFLLYRILILILLSVTCSVIAQPNPPITPKWALGHVVWEDSINTRQAAQSLVKLYKENNIPISAIIIDSPWSLSYNDFNWDTLRYPNPSEMIKELNTQDIRIILWLTGCVNVTANDVPIAKSPDYNFVLGNNFAVNNGEPSEWWKGVGVHIDFTNKKAVDWWDKKLDQVFVDGVYGWKVDQGEYYFGDSLSLTAENRKAGQDGRFFGDSLQTSKGRISLREFKGYYYDHMYDYTASKKSDGITLARPFSHQGDFAANISKLSLGWSGDFEGNWDGLKLQINNIYRSALAGYGALACEIGGFYESRSDKKQLMRYTQFASMTASMINGGQNGAFTNHLPWFHDEETTNIYRYYVSLHYELIPYIFSSLVDAHLKGGALLKEPSKERFSHKLGNDLFFKSIVSDKNKIKITLPDGDDWIDFWSDKFIKGGSSFEQTYNLKQAPIFVRAGAIIPMDISNDITAFGNASNKGKNTILIYPKGKSLYTFHNPLGEGIEYKDIEISYDDENGLLTVNGKDRDDYIFYIKQEKKPKQVTGTDAWFYDSKKSLLQIEKSGDDFSITIR